MTRRKFLQSLAAIPLALRVKAAAPKKTFMLSASTDFVTTLPVTDKPVQFIFLPGINAGKRQAMEAWIKSGARSGKSGLAIQHMKTLYPEYL